MATPGVDAIFRGAHRRAGRPTAGRRWGLTVMVGVLALGLVACGPTTTPGPKAEPTQPVSALDRARAAKPKGPVTVALLLPLTGQASAAGQRLQAAARRMAAGDRTLILKPFDTKGTVAGATAAADQAIAAKADLVLGPLYGANARAVAGPLAEAGIPALAFTNTTAAAGPGLFVLGHGPAAQVRQVLTRAAGQGKGRVVVAGPDTEYARLALQTARDMGGQGVRVVAAGLYPPGLGYQDLAQRVRDLARAPADVVLAPTSGLDLIGLSSLVQHYGGRGKRMVGTNLWEGTRALDREVSLRRAWFTSTRVEPPKVDLASIRETIAAHESAQADAAQEGDQVGKPDETGAPATGAEGAEAEATTTAATPPAGAADPIPAPPEYEPSSRARGAPSRGPRAPDALEALAMDAVALVQAWTRDREASLGDFLTRPGGFSGASGLFRLQDGGSVDRLYAIIEVTRRGLEMVEPPPQRFPGAPDAPLRLDRRTLPPSGSGDPAS